MKLLFIEEHKVFIFFILFVSLTLVCIPRFDRADYGIIKKFVGSEDLYEGLPIDILIYKNYVEYFRGEKNEESVMPPYSYRVLVPFLASKLPFQPLTSINLVNLFFLYIGLISIYLTLCILKLNYLLSITGCILFIFSFPAFYYGTSGYIDATFVGLLSAIVYFILSKKYFLLMPIIIVTSLANEKAIILFPFLVSFLFAEEKNLRKKIIIITSALTIYFLTSYLLRSFTPSNLQTYYWIPESKYILQNIFRPKTYLSFALTFGIPGIMTILSMFFFSADKIKSILYFYIGSLTSIILYLYSIISAWSDGRTLWTMYPFAIPVSVLLIENLIKDKKNPELN